MSFWSRHLRQSTYCLALGNFLRAEGQVLLVHVAQGDDVLAGDAAEMGFAPAPGADQGDVQLVAGRVGPEESGARQDEPGGSGEGDGFEELASFHGAILATGTRAASSSSLRTTGPAERPERSSLLFWWGGVDCLGSDRRSPQLLMTNYRLP